MMHLKLDFEVSDAVDNGTAAPTTQDKSNHFSIIADAIMYAIIFREI
jgi:hypothetical protein